LSTSVKALSNINCKLSDKRNALNKTNDKEKCTINACEKKQNKEKNFSRKAPIKNNELPQGKPNDLQNVLANTDTNAPHLGQQQ